MNDTEQTTEQKLRELCVRWITRESLLNRGHDMRREYEQIVAPKPANPFKVGDWVVDKGHTPARVADVRGDCIRPKWKDGYSSGAYYHYSMFLPIPPPPTDEWLRERGLDIVRCGEWKEGERYVTITGGSVSVTEPDGGTIYNKRRWIVRDVMKPAYRAFTAAEAMKHLGAAVRHNNSAVLVTGVHDAGVSLGDGTFVPYLTAAETVTFHPSGEPFGAREGGAK